MRADTKGVLGDLLDGDRRALAQAITIIENRQPGYRDLASELHHHSSGIEVIGVTGSPGSGKSTLVNRLAANQSAGGDAVAVLAIDPSSPYSGGAVLGDRIRIDTASTEGVFVRSMSARGHLGGLSAATADAIKAFDAAGFDRLIIETVGAGQNEVEIVRTADTVLVLVTPQSGDEVQMLKAGILEIADVFVVNKADLSGADRVVDQLQTMLQRAGELESAPANSWTPTIVEAIATDGSGIDELCAAIDDHRTYRNQQQGRDQRTHRRYRDEISRRLSEDLHALVLGHLEEHEGFDATVEQVVDRETDPYAVVEELLRPVRTCLERERGRDT